jgi:ankyrin repeat protein
MASSLTNRRTPLHLAISGDRGYSIASLLLAHGADLFSQDILRCAAFHDDFTETSIAVLEFHPEDAYYHSNDFMDRTMVYYVCSSKTTVLADFLCCYKRDSTLFDKVNKHGETVLHKACFAGNLEMVEFMLQHKPTPFSQPIESSHTPMHSAVFSDNVQVIDALFRNGFSIHAANGYGSTPLHLAVRIGNVVAVEKLLELGADADMAAVSSYYGGTPFQLALDCDCRRTEIAVLLLVRYPYLADQLDPEEVAILTSFKTRDLDELERLLDSIQTQAPTKQTSLASRSTHPTSLASRSKLPKSIASRAIHIVLETLGAYMILWLLLRLWTLVWNMI